MLFNSQEFVFLFLPLVLLVFLWLRQRGQSAPLVGWLLLASLGFYAWWDWRYLALLLGSVAVNWWLGLRVQAGRGSGQGRSWLWLGVLVNVALIAWFKYRLFLAGVFSASDPWLMGLGGLVLPLGISFFTFQQIAYLVDVHRGMAAERTASRYALFVTFFPQLIAGPIVHFRDVGAALATMPQRRGRSEDIAVGLSIFIVGLAKKVLVADSLALHAAPAFDGLVDGGTPTALAAWTAMLAYSLQIYFDFSGYSDMAVGLGRLFGIPLPVNFLSPYKARSITEFWRRWHITLSRFLRDYLYIPLGGNRHGRVRTYVNLLLVMLIGGLWHGANWTFVAWGGVHGSLLALERLWPRRLLELERLWPRRPRWPRPLAIALTFLLVTLAWVLFRAPTLEGALRFYGALASGAAGLPPAWQLAWTWIALAALLAFLAPNTTQLFRHHAPGLLPDDLAVADRGPAWRPARSHALALALLFVACALMLSRETVFLYFQF